LLSPKILFDVFRQKFTAVGRKMLPLNLERSFSKMPIILDRQQA